MNAILTYMERNFRVSAAAPSGAEIKVLDDKQYVAVGSNHFGIEDALKWGWLTEINPAERFDDEWDIEFSTEYGLEPLTGNPNVLASPAPTFNLRIVKGDQPVIEFTGLPKGCMKFSPGLLNEMIEKLNGS